MLRKVHRHDRYPSTLDHVEAFLTPGYEAASWVAVRGGAVAGHVALHNPPSSATMDFAASRLAGADSPVLVSRLFVDVNERGRGVARALLRTAAGHARASGLRAVLDVGQDFAAAVSLYDSEGWLRLGAERRAVASDVFDVWIYAAPVP